MKLETRIENIHSRIRKTKQHHLLFIDDTGIVRSVPYQAIVGIYDRNIRLQYLHDDIDYVLQGDDE